MADKSPVLGLCEETTCSICLEYFKDPVIIDCGHIFCQACLTDYCGASGTDVSCPQCRATVQQKNFRPNRQLASIVEIAKKFNLHKIKGEEALGQVCEWHQEPLKLFCQDDESPICVVCDKSKQHRGHKVIPKEEAVEEYKGKVQDHLEFLKKEKVTILHFQQSGETEGQTLLEQTEKERQKIMAQFTELHHFLEEQERRLLAELKSLDDQVKDMRSAYIANLDKEISAVDLLIKKMEEKQKQPASEFLQDIRNALQRCSKQKFESPVAFPLGLKQQIETFSETNPFLGTVMKDFKDTVLAGPKAKKANFTASGDCTIPTLVLSTDCSIKPNTFVYSTPVQHSLFNNFSQVHNQFSCWSYVMGEEKINSGICSWVMDIKNERFWAVGIALECFRGRNVSCVTPEQGIWAVGKTANNWLAFSSSAIFPVVCPWSSSCVYAHCIGPCNATTIRVSLNYTEGSVTFFNVTNNTVIYTFHKASFSGQPISSWFFVGK